MRALIIFIFSLLLTQCATSSPKVFYQAFEEELASNKQLIQSGQYRQAIDELSMLLEMAPDHEEARFLRALAYQHKEDLNKALTDYQMINKDPELVLKTHYNQGMIYAFKMNQSARALKHFDQFLSLAPRHRQAFSVAKIMASLDKSPSLLKNDTIKKAMRISQPNERREFLEQDVRKTPYHYFLIAQCYEHEGKDKLALKNYEKAVSEKPTCGPCHQSLTQLYRKLGKDDLAKQHEAKSKLFTKTL